MAYSTFGKGPQVVCLHPIGLSGQMWKDYVPSLGDSFSIIAIDLPGHGESPSLETDWTISTLADAVMVDLNIVSEQYVLMGASLGGMVAQEIAIRKPKNLTKLILADTLSGVREDQSIAIKQRATTAREYGMLTLMDDTIERWFTARFIEENHDVVAQVRYQLSVNDQYIHANCWEAIAAFNISERLPSIDIPVLAVAGSEDVSTPPSSAKAIANRVPNGRCQIVSEAGHMSMIEKPHEFVRIVGEFIFEEFT